MVEGNAIYSFDVGDEWCVVSEDVSTNPTEAWNQCKLIGNIQ